MAESKLPHIDERLGHVAVDMGLLTPSEVSDVQMRILRTSSAGGTAPSFGQAAIALGLLRQTDLEAIELEERRRRRLINGYEIINIIGTGNVATVYHARQLTMDREVALKILHPRLAQDPVFVRAYIAEAQAVSRFHHPNIVQGFDAGESNGFYYFAHEYLSGGSMADRIAAGATDFSENRLLMYLRQTTSALKHAWAVAVYHGDINPGNLLLDDRNHIKLSNLGVPRVAVMRKTESGPPAPGFVRCGPEYAAPEQLDRPETVNARTDIYSLGATFYHLSFGAPPWPGENSEAIVDLRRATPMPSFSLKRQEAFSSKYLRLIHDMLDPDPDKRPGDPEALADRLEKFHLADTDDLVGLAQQVRRAGGAKAPSLRWRHSTRSTPPNAETASRPFSLLPREPGRAPGRRSLWAAAAIAALAAALLLLFKK